MFVKNSNFVIYLTLALLVGFGASALLFSGSQSSLLSGDISKATRYNDVKEDPTFSAIEEKLQNDEKYLNSTKFAYALIGMRVDDLEDLSRRTIDLCSDIPELREAIKTVVMINAKAYNTKQAVSLATSSLDKIAAGKKAPEYEQASNSVFLGFQKMECQMSIGKAFVKEAVNYLEGKEGEEYSKIADLVTEWSVYCMQDALMNDSDKDVEYWESELTEMSAGSSLALAKSINDRFSDVKLVSKAVDSESLIVSQAEGLSSYASVVAASAVSDFAELQQSVGSMAELQSLGSMAEQQSVGSMAELQSLGSMAELQSLGSMAELQSLGSMAAISSTLVSPE